MRKKEVQISLFDIYNDVSEAIENKKPKVIALLEEHIDFEKTFPKDFIVPFIHASAGAISIIWKAT